MRLDVTGRAAHAGNAGRRHQRDRGDRPQDHQAARAHRPAEWRHLQCRHDLGRTDRQHGRSPRDRRGRSAVHRSRARGPRPAGRRGYRCRIQCPRHAARASRSSASSTRWSSSDASQRLFEHYAACARSLGQSVEPMFAGGCSDSGFAASAGAPTVCAVGPIGGHLHTPDEYLDIEFDRAARSGAGIDDHAIGRGIGRIRMPVQFPRRQ